VNKAYIVRVNISRYDMSQKGHIVDLYNKHTQRGPENVGNSSIRGLAFIHSLHAVVHVQSKRVPAVDPRRPRSALENTQASDRMQSIKAP